MIHQQVDFFKLHHKTQDSFNAVKRTSYFVRDIKNRNLADDIILSFLLDGQQVYIL